MKCSMTLHPEGGCLAIGAIRTGPGAVQARAGPARNRVSPHTAFIASEASPHSLPGRPLTNDSVNDIASPDSNSGLALGLITLSPITRVILPHQKIFQKIYKKYINKRKDPAEEILDKSIITHKKNWNKRTKQKLGVILKRYLEKN